VLPVEGAVATATAKGVRLSVSLTIHERKSIQNMMLGSHSETNAPEGRGT